MTMTLDDFLALAASDPHRAEQLIERACGIIFHSCPFRDCGHAANWAAFGAMWLALPRDGYTWQFGECAGGHYVTGHDRNHAPYYHVKAKSLNLAVAAALWLAAQKEGV